MTEPIHPGFIGKLAQLAERTMSRRNFMVRAAVVGSAVTVGGTNFVLRPVSAYAVVCGPEASCASGWTAFCCSINEGINQCPPGSFAGGWWKAGGANMCGGSARYVVDCQARCECGCDDGEYYCKKDCWNCEPDCANDRCDQRRVCKNVFRYGQCEQDIACSGPVWCRAVSCTPPWEWADCTRTSATDNRTVAHNASCLPDWNPIMRKYAKLGSQSSTMGESINSGVKLRPGRMQRFTGGRMYWSKQTGAYFVPKPLMSKYKMLDETTGSLGFPVRNPVVPAVGGNLAHFENGALYRASPDAEAFAVKGIIYDTWIDNTGAKGPLGVPVANSGATRVKGGKFGHFATGSIFQGPGLSPRAFWGPIAARYADLKYASGSLGFPTSGMVSLFASGGVGVTQVRFQRGTAVQVNESTAWAVWGPINTAWLAAGGVSGSWGVPTSDLFSKEDRVRGNFANGFATLDPTTGRVTFSPI